MVKIAETEIPEQDELVIVVIKKIMPYGAFCVLPEYNDKEAFLHISEVASRWIKNIHEFISEGQRAVAKVHHIDMTKNQIDVSLKKVSEEEKKKKLEQINFEKRAEKLFEVAIAESKTKVDPQEARKRIEEQYGDLFSCLKEASEKGEIAFKDIDIPKQLKASLIEIAKKNIKKPVVTVSGIITLNCTGNEGVETIKKALSMKEKDVAIHYLGAPRYKISLTMPDYKSAEKKLSSVISSIEDFAGKKDCTFKFEREE
ncbi:S1 RNA-binding domain-containing protein [Candidatus Micrarchaeota archaeon]|nr:S1 RNA-binding domain-containing protein [Candidatus Micrarchaeota archaeon]